MFSIASAQTPQFNYNPGNGYNQGGYSGSSQPNTYSNPGGFGAQSAPAARIAAAAPQNGTANQFSIPAAPTEAEAEPEAESAPWEMPAMIRKITEGGWLMIPLGVCSLIVIGLSLERMIALRRSRVIPKPFVRRFTECVEDGQLSYEEATSICDEFDCPVAEVFHAAVRRWGRPMMEIEQAVIDAGDRVGDSLRRFLRVFHAISNVTPLIGLLGTVLGMIQSFENLSPQGGGGQSEQLAAGISTALMTTAGGLSVAIPAYLAYMYFSAKSDRYLGEIDKLCQRVIDCISAEGLENAGAAKTPRKRRAA
ncbi:MotA/TolQ/ExbB proton channel family protein [Aporhodopirellula aestuarii]|uniref:MotA/TolQ/ExbB proton channel family protein n=1 Tax=Aporhodopirellula aestuarii TaxID=2950107 RepID=A0ABT0UBS0_9BACT|nr:MotA/TolQ/ExbB proton channel family protein [Aporhodopirellula aestuarii]MCM2374355.1 MotA/TolQ/ExbB proton channel family protein [Aporhodopirellula aestuarii]